MSQQQQHFQGSGTPHGAGPPSNARSTPMQQQGQQATPNMQQMWQWFSAMQLNQQPQQQQQSAQPFQPYPPQQATFQQQPPYPYQQPYQQPTPVDMYRSASAVPVQPAPYAVGNPMYQQQNTMPTYDPIAMQAMQHPFATMQRNPIMPMSPMDHPVAPPLVYQGTPTATPQGQYPPQPSAYQYYPRHIDQGPSYKHESGTSTPSREVSSFDRMSPPPTLSPHPPANVRAVPGIRPREEKRSMISNVQNVPTTSRNSEAQAAVRPNGTVFTSRGTQGDPNWKARALQEMGHKPAPDNIYAYSESLGEDQYLVYIIWNIVVGRTRYGVKTMVKELDALVRQSFEVFGNKKNGAVPPDMKFEQWLGLLEDHANDFGMQLVYRQKTMFVELNPNEL